jgi:CheY-like chemotaxis protein
MKNERILLVDDQKINTQTLQDYLPAYNPEDGHLIVGVANSLDELSKLMQSGLNPSLAIVDNRMPKDGDGQKAAKIIRQHSPDTLIASYSSDDNITWGDFNFKKGMKLADLASAITAIEH